MALTRQQKEEQLGSLIENMKTAKSIMFAHYIGLDVPKLSKLRRTLREKGALMQVAKKTLIRLAAKESGNPELGDDVLSGPVACVFSKEDPVAGASVLHKFGKDAEQVQLIGGIFSGKLLSKAEAIAFASLPSRESLLGTFIGMINSPLTAFASMCSSPLSGFARSVAELAKKKETSPSAN